MALRLQGGSGDLVMQRQGDTFTLAVPQAAAGARYCYVIDGERARPDPRSRFQPEGVHGLSEVVDPGAFRFVHARPRRPFGQQVLYELHVGTFSPAGNYQGVIERLPYLAALGVTTVELMPLGAFPGRRNWGYDGVHPFAPACAYGRPEELAALVDAAHGAGLAVIADVVYNHLGPEGNYLPEFAPYFTAARRTAWGDALAYDEPEVRSWIIDNARAWFDDYHVDGLRVDAIHAISDPSPRHILTELTERAGGGPLVAETDLNQRRVFSEWGFDAAWSDDFHHALHAALTGEREGYYRDFDGASALALAIEQGWVRGPEPTSARELDGSRFVVATQTHDQVGNRALGERLCHLVGPAAARLSAVALLAAAPGVPMLFQGEELAASAPFLYFTDHSDPELVEAVRAGRRREFAELGFAWPERIPDPQAPSTFERSRIDFDEARREPHAGMLRLYRDLLAMRARHPALGAGGKERCRAQARGKVIHVLRDQVLVVLNLGAQAVRVGEARAVLLHSEAAAYGGALREPGPVLPARSAAVFSV
jgi:maltooligosyltrehalose trehalohydrolase